MKIQGSGPAQRQPVDVNEASKVQGSQTNTQASIAAGTAEPPPPGAVTPTNHLDGYEGIKAGQAKSLEPASQLPDLNFHQLSELSSEVKQKMEQTRQGKGGGGASIEEVDSDGDGISDNDDSDPSMPD